jgi:hypothetical protein
LVVFGLSICTATGKDSSFGNKIILLGFLGVTWVGKNYSKKLGMLVIAERMKMCCYLHMEKNPYVQLVS